MNPRRPSARRRPESVVESGQVEQAETHGVGEDVDRDDLPALTVIAPTANGSPSRIPTAVGDDRDLPLPDRLEQAAVRGGGVSRSSTSTTPPQPPCSHPSTTARRSTASSTTSPAPVRE
jgi:hypothetical protein